jgi:mono/diheme cytochrome c family protein
MRRTSISACWLAVTLSATLGGCGAPAPPPAMPVFPPVPMLPQSVPPPPGGTYANPIVALEQGWSPELIRAWYRRPQGSQLVPYDWFLALEQATNDTTFRAGDVIDRFRYISDVQGAGNPDALPIGFARGDDDKGRAWLGFTCAACHTAQIDHDGKSIRIEGGPGMGDLVGFRDELIAAFRATLQDEGKFGRFAAKSLKEKATPEATKGLRDEVQVFLQGLVDQAERSRPQSPQGFGRLDAVSLLMNEMTGSVAGEPANYRKPVAPVSYPFLWGASRLEWVQWNGVAQNAINRNVGEALTVFGHAEATVKGDDLMIRSSAKIKNLIDLEEWTKTLAPPRWPEEILGEIDRDKARRGGEVYRKAGCATCHAEKPPYPESSPNKYGKTFTKVARTPLAELKTDPVMAENFLNRTAKPGKFAPLFPGVSEVPAWQMVQIGLSKLVESDLLAAGLESEQILEASGFREPAILAKEEMLGYKSGPLAGIWATAPYLHNGSVPSLYQLLLPPDQRVKVFHVGSREFDPKNVGFDTGSVLKAFFDNERPADAFEFRTEVPGNANTGHTFGVDLSEDDRWALVEYLKTL